MANNMANNMTNNMANNAANNMANNAANNMANNATNNMANNRIMANDPNFVCAHAYVDGDYPVDVKSEIPFELRSTDVNSQVAAPPVNGGLYCGPQNDAPWMPKSVPPTTTYFIQTLLKNADPPPPPGATEQYPGENRLGNNYTPMPGVNWYNSAYERNKGPFNLKVMSEKH